MTDPAAMDCRELESLLADYIGGELPGPARHRADAHLADCPACRAQVDALSAARDLVSAASGDDAWAGRAVGGAAAPARDARPAPWLRALAAAAVIALVFAIGFAAGRNTSPPVAPRPDPARQAQVERPDFAERYARAARDFPRAGSMAWALTGLARRR